MAQLDETIDVDQSGHIEDHEQLHSKANYVFDVKDFGAVGDGVTDDTAAIDAARDAAHAAGLGTSIYLPPGTYITSGLALSGTGIGIVGDGPRSKMKAKSGITGAVLDTNGWLPFQSWVGKPLFHDFMIEGDGISDPTKTHYGMDTTDLHGASVRNIGISETGGPGWYCEASYLTTYEDVVVWRPPHADTDDVPYVYFRGGMNGSRITGTGLRSSTSADDGSVVFLIEDGDTHAGHDVTILGTWCEYQHTPENGAVMDFAIGQSTIEAPMTFDMNAAASSTNTAIIRMSPYPNGSSGGTTGNRIFGTIPSRGTQSTAHAYGVDLLVGGVSVVGTKGYNGYNVRLGSGVGYSYINLMTGMSITTLAGVVDNSGETTNTILDPIGNTYPAIKTGSGSPEGVVVAAVGSLFQRTDGATGTSLYIKESGTGNTGWIASEGAAAYLELAGGTMAGNIAMAGNDITGAESIGTGHLAFGGNPDISFTGTLDFRNDNPAVKIIDTIDGTRYAALSLETSGGAATFYMDNDLKLTMGSGDRIKVQRPASGNDIVFYKADGTTEAFIWDESLDHWRFATEVAIDGDLNHDGTNVGFYGTTPTTKPTSTADIKDALVSLGLLTDSGATPLDLDGGTATLGATTVEDDLTITDAKNIVLDTTTGTKIGTATTQKLGFYNATPVPQASAYTPTNVTTDRTYDADTVAVAELADIVGTLIQDLQATGLIG